MDLNNDGHFDILSGSHVGRGGGLFYVLWGQPDGSFKKPEVLNSATGRLLIVRGEGLPNVRGQQYCTRPFAIDWDGDGKLDLVVGNQEGTFFLFLGKGKGKIVAESSCLKTGKKLLKIEGAHSAPFVIDWDGDGDLDLLSGSSSGGVQWAENQAGKGKPIDLKPFVYLIKPTAYPKSATLTGCKDKDLIGPVKCTRIWVADVNSDGRLDILVGDRAKMRASKLSDEELDKEYAKRAKEDAAWKEASAAVYAAIAKAKGKEREKLAKQRNQIRQERNKVVRKRQRLTKSSGFIWLYLQKK